jgi:biotin carboxyl carrier protein
LRVTGVPTTTPLAAAILDHPDFIEARHHTGSVENDWSSMICEIAGVWSAEAGSEPEVRPERRVVLPGAGNWVVRICGTLVPNGPADEAAGNRSPDAANMLGRRGVSAAGSLASPMDATVVKTLVEPADLVEADQPLLILEAMKMEVTFRSPRAGRVARLGCSAGDTIVKGQLLVELEAPE